MRPLPYVPPLQFPPRRESPTGEPGGLGGPTGTDHKGGPALGTWGRTRGARGGQDPGDPELPSSTVQALPVRVGPANPGGERTYQYWPFSTSDLYNWKTQNLPFSEKPQGLTDLLDSLTTSPGTIVSSCCRCSSPEKNGSEFWQRPGNGSRRSMGDQLLSLISWTRGFLCCGLTGILSE